MENNIERLRDETGQIFNLLRDTAAETGALTARIGNLEISQKAGFDLMAAKQETQFAEILAEVKRRPPAKKWGPAHTATVAVALITAAATVLTACFGGPRP